MPYNNKMAQVEIKHKAQDLLMDSMITAGYKLFESISDDEISPEDKDLVFQEMKVQALRVYKYLGYEITLEEVNLS